MARSGFMPSALLAAVFVAAKGVLAWPLTTVQGWANLLAISAEDLVAVVVFGLLASLLLRMARGRAALERWVWRAVIVCGAVAALYAIANIGIYRCLRQPLNVRMLGLMGRLTDLRSSLAEHWNWPVTAAAVVVAVAYLLAVRGRSHIAPRRGLSVGLISLTVAWVACGLALRARASHDAWQQRAGKNPHREFLVSLVSRWLLDDRVEIDGGFPPEYLDDFKLAAQRRCPPLEQFSTPPKNVIVVVLESTTAQYMSLYGSHYDTTPNLVRESAHALVFDRFYAHVGYTFCSMMPIVYSVHPGLPWCYRPGGPRPMPPGMAEVLKERGRRTAFFTAANPEWEGVGVMAQRAGMDEVFGPAELGGQMVSSWGTEDRAVFDGLIRWIDSQPGRPFYALMWTDQTHDPYTLARDTSPVDFLDETTFQRGVLLERYLNAIRQADQQIGRLFEALRSRGLAEDTLVVITGDHGEAFGELHDVVGHGTGLFDENLRVPLMLWNPRLFPAGRRVGKAGGHMDLNPTIAHLLGLRPPADWQGASLFSDDHPGRVYLQAGFSEHQLGLTDGRWKYMRYANGACERLYDLEADPAERHDLSGRWPEVTLEMRARVSAFLRAQEDYVQQKAAPR